MVEEYLANGQIHLLIQPGSTHALTDYPTLTEDNFKQELARAISNMGMPVNLYFMVQKSAGNASETRHPGTLDASHKPTGPRMKAVTFTGPAMFSPPLTQHPTSYHAQQPHLQLPAHQGRLSLS